MSEHVFPIPNVKFADEVYVELPAVRRQYMAIRDAMKANDSHRVGNRQLRLLGAGLEIPITLEHCNRLLEKYEHAS